MATINKTNFRELNDLYAAFAAVKKKGLRLNMARGKPGVEQLALSMPLLDVLSSSSNCIDSGGVDCRNYGCLEGIQEARKLFGEYLGVLPEETMVLGSSSLNFMADCLTRAMLFGVLGSTEAWGELPQISFLCPIPGYDRHFAICEKLGIQMINVPMSETGPDMNVVEHLVGEDPTIKGIWCVPKFSNPLGITYSDETVQRFAALEPKAKDFRIFWDNAYAEHAIYRDTPLLNILDACKAAGHPDMVYLFGSTNKITLPGAGVAIFAASADNICYTAEQVTFQSISWDKMNMLRHVRFLKSVTNIRKHMAQHADILRPRFDVVIGCLERELVSKGLGSYVQPDGGYFITYKAPAGTARRIVALCREAGVTLTSAGATHPYGHDPDDSIIRIAPSYPPIADLEEAMIVFSLAVQIAVLDLATGKSGQ